MRVLHVYRTYYPDSPGGVQEAIRQIAFSTRPFGVTSRIFALSPRPGARGEIERPEGRVVRARSWLAPASCDLGGAATVTRFHREAHQADVIHYHFPWPYADLLHLLLRPPAPAVMTYHSDVVNKGYLESLYAPMMKAMLRRMQAVVATSPPYAETSTTLTRHVRGDQLRIIPLGLSESTYQDARARSRTINPAADLGLEPNGYFLFIGSLRSYKGLHVLAKAAADSPLPIVIAGNGKERALVEALATDHPRVHHVSEFDDSTKLALLRDCRALVLPSTERSEAFGVVLLEAAMMARPAISTTIGTGTSYVNQHEITGLCIEPGSPDALRMAFHQLMDDEMVARFGRNARKRYDTLFSGTALGESYAALYQETAHQANPESS